MSKFRDLDEFLPSYENIEKARISRFEVSIIKQLGKLARLPPASVSRQAESLSLSEFSVTVGLPLVLHAAVVRNLDGLDAKLDSKPERTSLYREYADIKMTYEDEDELVGLVFSWPKHSRFAVLHNMNLNNPSKGGRWFRAGPNNILYLVETLAHMMERFPNLADDYR